MRAIEEEFGVPIGSGYSHDVQTIAFLKMWIRETGTLPRNTRTSWDTARRLLAESRSRKLEEFGEGKSRGRCSRTRSASLMPRSAPMRHCVPKWGTYARAF